MKALLLLITLLASSLSFANSEEKFDLEAFKRDLEVAANKASAKTNITFCAPEVSEDFYNWGCEKAIIDAIRASIDIKDIIIPLVFKSMNSPKGIVFDENKVDKESLASDIKLLIQDIGKISEENIDEVSKTINEQTQVLAKRHYHYN